MRILIIRHGDPDYEIDGLTEKGKREAKLLVPRLEKENITAVFTSPLGRAMRTAEPTLEKLGMTAEICEWLREFNYAKVQVPYREKPVNPWNFMPSYLEQDEGIYQNPGWQDWDGLKATEYTAQYQAVCEGLDALIGRFGYRRRGAVYEAVKPNHDTVALFCHHGLGSALISHLLNLSPLAVTQGFCLLPTSVTTLCTEEREEGIAQFRMTACGDTSHLYAADEPPAFSARFCECFTDDTRH